MKYLFLDESGDHNLDPTKIDPNFPYFLLTGIVIDSAEYKKLQRALLKTKLKFFKNKRLILHSKEITRPNISKQKGLGILTNPKIRGEFYRTLNDLIQNIDFKIVCYSISKKKVVKTLKGSVVDLYFLSFSKVFTGFEKGLKRKEHGKIFAESRNKSLDKQFVLTWINTKITKRYKALEPEILKKSWEHSGIEIADLISYRIARKVSKKKPKPIGNELSFGIIKKKKLFLGKF